MPKTTLLMPGFFVSRRPRSLTFLTTGFSFGPLPVAFNFTKRWGDSTIVYFLGGTCFATVAGSTVAINADIDGLAMTGWQMFITEANSHRALPARARSHPVIAAGAHTLNLVASAGTNIGSDGNDVYYVSIWENPP